MMYILLKHGIEYQNYLARAGYHKMLQKELKILLLLHTLIIGENMLIQ